MSRATDLFERLETGGVAYLRELIAARELESPFLEFKGSRASGGSQLSGDDNKNLSRAISGFGNSSGGVIVWGVDCRADASGAEQATEMPLADAFGFRGKIESAVSRATIPPHAGVRTLFIGDGGDATAGFVATLVPQADEGPLRAVVGDQYLLRAGSAFMPVPHDVLAGMFGRRPQPVVHLNVISHPARLDGRPGHLTLAMGLVAVNLGNVIAERPYLSVQYLNLQRELMVAQVPTGATNDYVLRHDSLPASSIMGKVGVVIPPGGVDHLCDVVIDVDVRRPVAIRLKCAIGVQHAPPKRFELVATEAAVAEAIERGRAGQFPTSEVLILIPQV
jgi:hypothetical protein